MPRAGEILRGSLREGVPVIRAMTEAALPLCGVLVGGRSSRMGGAPKGLLPAPGAPEESVVARIVRAARGAGCDVVLLGEARAYEHELPGLRALADSPPGVGPLGGLRALLECAGAGDAIALACDMPHVTPEAVALLCGREASSAIDVFAARRSADAPWEPWFARYRPASVLPAIDRALARGEHSLQALFRAVRVAEIALPPHLASVLDDWDTPDDVARVHRPARP